MTQQRTPRQTRRLHFIVLASLAFAGAFACGTGDEADPTTIARPGTQPPATRDGGVTMDAGVVVNAPRDGGVEEMPQMCPDGYAGPRCDQCARGWQDGNADGVCSLACDAVDENAPDCGQGQCFIDTTTDTRACACNEGHVGESCDQCDVGYDDPDADGICTRACQLSCGAFGTCEIAADDSESCICEEGYEGAACDLCSAGYEAFRGTCVLALPSEVDLALWLDADMPTSLTISRGGDVQSWEDRRGARGATELTAAIASQRPAYTDNSLNGRPVIRFDGIDDRLFVPDFTALGGDDYTVFAMVRPRDLMTGGVFAASHLELGTAVALDLTNPGSGVRFVHSLPGMPNSRDEVASDAFGPLQATLVSVRRTTSGLLNYMRMNGALRGDVMGVEADDVVLSVGNVTGSLRLSLGTGLEGNAFDGDIAEFLVYRRALEVDETRQVLEYLAAKWGVQ